MTGAELWDHGPREGKNYMAAARASKLLILKGLAAYCLWSKRLDDLRSNS